MNDFIKTAIGISILFSVPTLCRGVAKALEHNVEYRKCINEESIRKIVNEEMKKIKNEE